MKKGKKQVVFLSILAMILGTTGCVDHMPDMTKEQTELVAEYAAGLLLKYSPNYKYPLVDEETLETIEENSSEEESVEMTSETMAETETQKDTIVVEATVTSESETESDQDTTVVIVGDEDQLNEETLQETLDMTVADLAELFELTGLSITYQGMERKDSYENLTSVVAKENFDLMLLHFSMTNMTSEPVSCMLGKEEIDFRVNLNSLGYQKAEWTLLLEDLLTYVGDVPAGETQQVLVVIQVPEVESVESVIARIAYKDKVEIYEIK